MFILISMILKPIELTFHGFHYIFITLPKMILEKGINTAFDSHKESKKAERAAKHLSRAKIKEAKINQETAMATNGADELRKYKQLMDDGIITADEFAKKKKQILG